MTHAQGTFQRRYHSFDRIWADCYIGYKFVDFECRASTKEAVVAWFAEHSAVEVFAVAGCGANRLHIEQNTFREIPSREATSLIETMLQQAVRYGSGEPLSSDDSHELATLFLSEFESPLVLANFRLSEARGRPYIGALTSVVSGYGYSCEALLCCVDRHRLGFLFSIENE